MAKKQADYNDIIGFGGHKPHVEFGGIRYGPGTAISAARSGLDRDDVLRHKYVRAGMILRDLEHKEVQKWRSWRGLDLDSATADEGEVIDTDVSRPAARIPRDAFESELQTAADLEAETAEPEAELKAAKFYASLDLPAYMAELERQIEEKRAEAEKHRKRAGEILKADAARRGLSLNGGGE